MNENENEDGAVSMSVHCGAGCDSCSSTCGELNSNHDPNYHICGNGHKTSR